MPALQEAGAPDADSITTFGFTNPVPIDETNMILAGHRRVAAAADRARAFRPQREQRIRAT